MESEKELWEELSELARAEQNPTRFLELINQINRLLDDKQKQLQERKQHD